MKYFLTPTEMREADSIAIKKYGIPGAILMENAARSAADIIFRSIDGENDIFFDKVLILCGSGNNGGDGFALARHLFELYDVTVYWLGSEEKMSPETHTNYLASTCLGIEIKHISDDKTAFESNYNFDVIIDAMIGVGGSENIKGLASIILEAISRIEALKIAIDAPTGLNTETGAVYEFCFKADHTITMFAIKSGMLLGHSPDYCGQIHLSYLGAPESIVEEIATIKSLEDMDLRFLIPERKRQSSKFDYGRVVIVAGSNKFPGAAALCANAAIKSGAGLVQLYTTLIHPALLPEVIVNILPDNSDGSISEDSYNLLSNECKKADCLIIGPGLGNSTETLAMISKLLNTISQDLPVVIDADGLNVLDKSSKLRKNICLTPHSGELSRLTGIDRKLLESNPINYSKDWSNKLECNVLLKTVPVVISNGTEVFINQTGNAGMASGGSGDVLSGIIGGLIAQGVPVFKAAVLGAYLHGRAGDIYSESFPLHSLSASNLIDYLQEAFKSI